MKAKIKEIAHKTLGNALDTILPLRCVITGEMVDRQGMLAPGVWAKLDFIRDPMCDKCGVPFGFDTSGFEVSGIETESGMQCLQCLDYPPPFASARSALRYNDDSRDLILGFKHADQTHAVTAFMPWLKTAGADMLEKADALIPVPLHRWRLLKRRYNQAAIIGHYLGKEMQIPHWPEALLRIRATPTQGHLSFKERRKNVKKAFIVNPTYAEQVKGKKLVLIDDVYTTGSTVKECARVLKRAGAQEIHILTIARVARFES